jgi:uncharacterized SAM-binding protein YcdF (DUF218 family)
MELGVPKAAIALEEQSGRTHDSAVNSAMLARRAGWKSVILVTSRVHILRARLAFATAGVPARALAASDKDLWVISNASERISLLHEATHEYLGLMFYRIRGWV